MPPDPPPRKTHEPGAASSPAQPVVSDRCFFSRLQLRFLIDRYGHRRIILILFVLSAGMTALAIITFMAWITDLPLLFPPLGPSAFILFHTPLAETASPRNVLLSHALALAAGLLSLWATAHLAAAMGGAAFGAFNGAQVAAIVAAIGMVSVAMVALGCVHPPAAATALIAAMGFVGNWAQAAGMVVAVILLVVAAVVFNRVVGGLPYPLWRYDPSVLRTYGEMAGMPSDGRTDWQRLAARTFHHR